MAFAAQVICCEGEPDGQADGVAVPQWTGRTTESACGIGCSLLLQYACLHR
jgi:hypothetical protein